jgi:hypothetical protein
MHTMGNLPIRTRVPVKACVPVPELAARHHSQEGSARRAELDRPEWLESMGYLNTVWTGSANRPI